MTIKEKAARIAESFAIQLRTYGLGLGENVLRDCAANAAMALEADDESPARSRTWRPSDRFEADMENPPEPTRALVDLFRKVQP